MATMNISLPDKMKEWVEQQVARGRYANASDVMRDVIRERQDKDAALEELRAEIQLGLDSRVSSRTPEELREYAHRRADEAMKRNGLADDRSRR
ncbi:MAG TPA: type II toxin-antitoxin system ParD family antitoxin [Devosia sp.]